VLTLASVGSSVAEGALRAPTVQEPAPAPQTAVGAPAATPQTPPAAASVDSLVAGITSRSTAADPLTVFLVTAAPGDAIWERFGHNGLWIHDARTGEDLFWEWGLFSFDQPGFLLRLARGTMLYSMGGRPFGPVVDAYRAANRPMWVQELALEPAQEQELNAFVRTNAQPENRQYTYHYYLDNCSTRVRDAIDRVLDGRIQSAFEMVPTGATWRWHTRRLLRHDTAAEAGLQFVLGNPGDERISAYQEMFLPMRLREHVRSTTVVTPNGTERPLVVRETQLLDTTRPPYPKEPSQRLFWASLGIGLLLAGGVVGLGRGAKSGRDGMLRLLGLASVVWWTVIGVAGLLLGLAWAFTDHDFWRWNENLFLANPLLLAAALYSLPLLLGRAPGPRLEGVVESIVGFSLVGVAAGVMPGLDQQNLEMIVLLLPTHLALAWTVIDLRKRAA
jgi:hypothetical protein